MYIIKVSEGSTDRNFAASSKDAFRDEEDHQLNRRDIIDNLKGQPHMSRLEDQCYQGLKSLQVLRIHLISTNVKILTTEANLFARWEWVVVYFLIHFQVDQCQPRFPMLAFEQIMYIVFESNTT